MLGKHKADNELAESPAAAGIDLVALGKSLFGFSDIQARGAWWDPLNLFTGPSDAATPSPVNTTTTTTTTTVKPPTTVAPAPSGGGGWNPFGFITAPFVAIGQGVQNLGTGLVNMVTGGGGTTSTTPFPYPAVAAFFSDPGAVASGNKNVTLKPDIVKCLSNLVNLYTGLLIRINNFLPNCISGQKFSAVWLLPQLLGLLPALKLIDVPHDVLAKCKYIDGCVLKATQTTIYEVDKAIWGVSKSLRDALPGLTNIGKTVIHCMSDEFTRVAKELPSSANMKCLKQ